MIFVYKIYIRRPWAVDWQLKMTQQPTRILLCYTITSLDDGTYYIYLYTQRPKPLFFLMINVNIINRDLVTLKSLQLYKQYARFLGSNRKKKKYQFDFVF